MIPDRLMRKVSPEPNTGCWLWTAYTNRGGYGVVGEKTPRKRTVLAHRAVWETVKGPLSDGQCVLHRCDQRCCVNPEHLWVGTKDDNNKDRAAKGRSSRGQHRNTSKLSPKQVLEIRFRASRGEQLKRLGKEYGVAWQTIQGIRDRKYWGWLQDQHEEAS
jgi:hypothetical protein